MQTAATFEGGGRDGGRNRAWPRPCLARRCKGFEDAHWCSTAEEQWDLGGGRGWRMAKSSGGRVSRVSQAESRQATGCGASLAQVQA